MTGLKISIPNCRQPDWAEKPNEESDSMQQVFKNSLQSLKKVTTFGENISPAQCQPYASETQPLLIQLNNILLCIVC